MVFSVKLHLGLIPYTLTLDPRPLSHIPCSLSPIDLGINKVWVLGGRVIVLKGRGGIVPKGIRGIVLKTGVRQYFIASMFSNT